MIVSKIDEFRCRDPTGVGWNLADGLFSSCDGPLERQTKSGFGLSGDLGREYLVNEIFRTLIFTKKRETLLDDGV